jgi:hypothetical protein
MSRTLNNHQKLSLVGIYEQNIEELFDSPPLSTSFIFTDEPWKVSTKFLDGKNNKIKVYFHKEGKDLYTVDFMVNNISYSSNLNYSVKEYSSLIHTIYLTINQFLEEFSPKALDIGGADSFQKIEKGKEGQKSLIYRYASKFFSPNPNYKVLTKPNGDLNIINKIN